MYPISLMGCIYEEFFVYYNMDIQSEEGVYCLRNKKNSKIYIGSSENVKQRYSSHKSRFKLKKCFSGIMGNVYQKYNFNDFEFQVLLYTKDYLHWEELLIKLLKPEYNTAGILKQKLQPNLGKKFNQEWIDKLGRCEKHSIETLEKLTKLNKENACRLTFSKEGSVLTFDSWVDAGNYFKVSNTSLINSFKRKKSWKGWVIKKLKTQKKRVLLTFDTNELEFESASKCDKFLNLWRGATSNAIRNKSGNLHNYKVKYI